MNSSFNHTATTHPPTSLIETLGQTTIIILLASYAINLALSVPTNGYIVKLILSENLEKVSSDIFQLNMSVSELVFSLSGVLFLLRLFLSSSFLNTAFFFCCGFSFTSRPLFQSCICVDQYLAAVRPLVFLRCKPLRYRVPVCGVVWLATLPLAVVCAVFSFGRLFFLLVGIQCSGFLMVISYCCGAVLQVLKRPRPGQGEREASGGISDRTRKAFRYIRIHLLYTFFTNMPMLVVAFFSKTLQEKLLYTAVGLLFAFFIVSGVVPSVLYLCRVGKLRCSCVQSRAG